MFSVPFRIFSIGIIYLLFDDKIPGLQIRHSRQIIFPAFLHFDWWNKLWNGDRHIYLAYCNYRCYTVDDRIESAAKYIFQETAV